MKPILMIHEVAEWIFDLPLQDYTLTFDDGLYTQYLYFDKINKIDTDKIFFITTGIVATEQTTQTNTFITCSAAHDAFFNTGELKHYMNWSQIKKIAMEPECSIGGHSHYHNRPNMKTMINDTNLMCDAFKQQELQTDCFCFPYNDECEVYKRVLQKRGFKKFYGSNRIDINDL